MSALQSYDMNPGKHLIWDLDDFDNHHRAAAFVKQFQDTLCVYSNKVEQLYTNYDISLPKDAHKSMVVLPNPYAFHDTFSRVNPEAVSATKLIILPGQLLGRHGLYIRLPMSNRRGRVVPLANGLRAVMNACQKKGSEFLPVITKGDLRAFRQDYPALHLHRFHPERLTNLSEFDARGIRKAILHRLTPHMG